MKLEALWILQNLTCCEHNDMLQITDHSVQGQGILDHLDTIMKQIVEDGSKDVRTLSSVMQVLWNIAITNEELATLVVNCTDVVQYAAAILNQKTMIDKHLLLCIVNLIKSVFKRCVVDEQTLKLIMTAAMIGV